MEELAASKATPPLCSSSQRDGPNHGGVHRDVNLDPFCRHGGEARRQVGATAREERGWTQAGGAMREEEVVKE
jgi:hypothetical protein